MDEYSVVREHVAANITLLCGLHHDLKSRGHLPTEIVRNADSSPHNSRGQETAPHHLFYFGQNAEIIAGGNSVSVVGQNTSAITIDGHSLVGFDLIDGSLMLNLDFHDADGTPVLTVRRNELVHSTHLWDYQFVGQTLSIREKQRQIYLTVTFEADRHRVIIEKGLVAHNGVDLLFDRRGLAILNNRILLSGNSIAGLGTAIAIGNNSESAGPTAFQMDISRAPYDKDAAVAWAREEMAKYDARGTNQAIGFDDRTNVHVPSVRPSWLSVATLPYPWSMASCGIPT
jgi:hypothetical protein